MVTTFYKHRSPYFYGPLYPRGYRRINADKDSKFLKKTKNVSGSRFVTSLGSYTWKLMMSQKCGVLTHADKRTAPHAKNIWLEDWRLFLKKQRSLKLRKRSDASILKLTFFTEHKGNFN